VHDFANNVGRQKKKYQPSRGLSAIAELLVSITFKQKIRAMERVSASPMLKIALQLQ